MELTVPFGIVLAIYLLLRAIGYETGLKLFLHYESMYIVFGGTIGAALVHFPFSQFYELFPRLSVVFSLKKRNSRHKIIEILDLSLKMRTQGPQGLKQAMDTEKDPFLKLGFQLIFDQVTPDKIKEVMEKKIELSDYRHQLGISFFSNAAKYAPGFGLIGTLIGLIIMLRELDRPEMLGKNMSIALITTFYGSLLANLILLPLAGRLTILNNEEILQKKMYLEGILGIAKLEPKMIILENMAMFLPGKELKKLMKDIQK